MGAIFCPALFAQPAPDDPAGGAIPAIQAMVKTLLTETVDSSLRQAQAKALLQYPQQAEEAQQALIDILNGENNLSAKIIVCRAIVNRPDPLLAPQGLSELSPGFIDPLFAALISDQPELSAVAAQALTKCRDGVGQRLATMAQDITQSQSHRLAAIMALELLTGKGPVLALAELLDESQPEPIRRRAAQALANMLYSQPPADLDGFIREFLLRHLPLIRSMDDESFLHWQVNRLKQKLNAAQTQIEQVQQQSLLWLKRYQDRLTAEFNGLAQPADRLNLVRKNLVDQTNEYLRVWAMERIKDWSALETVQSSPVAAEIVELVKPYLADPHGPVRQLAAATLGSLVENARPTAPLLLEQLSRETNPAVQAALLQTLSTMEYLPAADSALQLLDASNPLVAGPAARTLGRLCATQPVALSAEKVEQIAQALGRRYPEFPDRVDVRLDLLLAMRKIAGQAKYRDLAGRLFSAILTGALGDPSERIRSEAVYALADVYQEKAIPQLLQPKNLLDDTDTAVRLAVLGALQSYPDKAQLPILRQRLEREDNSEVANQIRSTFAKILAGQPLETIYQWCLDLQKNNGAANGVSEPQRLLLDRTVAVLAEKLNQAKTANLAYPATYEVLVLTHQAESALKANQPAQAIILYQGLLGLKEPDENQKDAWRLRILEIALQTSQDAALLSQSRSAVQALLKRPAAPLALKTIAQAVDHHQQTEETLLFAAQILTTLILPLQVEMAPELQNEWNQRRLAVALQLIETQERLLSATPAKENPQAIALLAKLDGRLNDYPANEPLEIRKAALARFRQILQPSSPEVRPVPPADANSLSVRLQSAATPDGAIRPVP
ncbi:MAG: HEAT repeat domain-containing protein [Sedimentisphaerales bacterium]|nr:HEAT repeat domain-containing protein [Sedimentisphaerales bacterium]